MPEETYMSGTARWANLNTAFENYLSYISKKTDRLSLSILDLLYTSNFKGGNASIVDPESMINTRLKLYEVMLRSCESQFGSRNLGELQSIDLDTFIQLAEAFIALPLTADATIRGLKCSYASALLCAHFPHLAPVLDRNVLAGAGIQHATTSQGQVIDIQQYYGPLIHYVYALQRRSNMKPLREIDRELFIGGAKAIAALKKQSRIAVNRVR
jgi:hypothetical protein